LLRENILLQVSVAFIIVLAVKWPVLHDPPVWDTAMSVFPAAITLVEYDFDLPRLLKEPGHHGFGPRSYADSLITIITAVIIEAAGKTNALFPTVHLLHFLITALTLVAIYRYAKPLLGEDISVLFVLALLMFPLFFVQAGYMYLEMPLLLAAVMALLAWRSGNLYEAALWAAIAIWIKPTGLIVTGVLCLAALSGPWPVRGKLYRLVVLSLLPLSSARTKVEERNAMSSSEAVFPPFAR